MGFCPRTPSNRPTNDNWKKSKKKLKKSRFTPNWSVPSQHKGGWGSGVHGVMPWARDGGRKKRRTDGDRRSEAIAYPSTHQVFGKIAILTPSSLWGYQYKYWEVRENKMQIKGVQNRKKVAEHYLPLTRQTFNTKAEGVSHIRSSSSLSSAKPSQRSITPFLPPLRRKNPGEGNDARVVSSISGLFLVNL